ncbi:MAG: DbpA RNA binding domain-containing protein, partial [Sandaracinaceae bacterium]
LFLPVGKRRGVRPEDLVGALANELGIPSGDIGRITISANASFIRVPVEVADHLIQDVRRIQIRGVEVPLVEARPSAHPRAEHAGPSKGFRKQGRPAQRPRPFRPKR